MEEGGVAMNALQRLALQPGLIAITFLQGVVLVGLPYFQPHTRHCKGVLTMHTLEWIHWNGLPPAPHWGPIVIGSLLRIHWHAFIAPCHCHGSIGKGHIADRHTIGRYN